MSTITPTFSGEFQLAGWSESHNGGCKVTFWLPDSSDLDAFRALTVRKGQQAGHRLAAVLVEIGDDEQPVQPPKAEAAKGGALAKLAAQFCADEQFWRFIGETFGDEVHDSDQCALWVRCQCEIKSRAELDSNEGAADYFHTHIRKPWVQWRKDWGLA
ncbi:hypothetical protein FHX57_006772 [Paraburkholderia tropica]|uniref:hypothetical protein n=1 Tax=Paraburkholderia tropica TaxID=92647 RepID=UPI001618CBD0|nr:hypothetical protein [Paraburkholderia tropica]MBB3004390.1 hypothetical protein [Paraburkholderia tropica]